jgi:transcriptional regulator with XRE-family HTH domain
LSNRRGVSTEEGARTVGQRLAQLRKGRGITQVDMAKLLGVAQSVYSAYERGAVRMHAELLIQLSRILKVTADGILGLEESEHELASLDRRLLRRLQKIETLSRRQQQALIRTLDEFLERVGGG